VVLAEGVLLSPAGGPDVMVEQLDHLIEVAQRPNIEIRLIDPDRRPSAISGFELLTRQGEIRPFMAVTFSVDGPDYIDVEDRVAKFVRRFDHLVSTALSTTETLQRLHDIRKTHGRKSNYR
jgi:hypothetical protein